MTLEGVLLQKLSTKSGRGAKGAWTNTQFTLQPKEGKTLKCNTFGAFENEWIGQMVRFDGVYQEKYNNYQAESEIEVVGELDSVPIAPTAMAEAPKKRGRKAKAETVVPTQSTTLVTSQSDNLTQPSEDNDSEREAYRSRAEAAVVENLQSALRIAKSLNLNPSTADLVALADIAGRTQTALFMDAKKDQRMSSFKRR